ncbi:MAG: hypothetical protein IJP77_10950 [Bacteroidales bacterium]|nr:hypothetical protein [Bacteroidales bacterium]
MMKRTTTILTIILAGLMVMLAGCQEPLDFNVKKGESIRVKVSSRRGAATKTEYSGAIYTDNGARYERIDWKQGDSLRLYSTDASLVATSDGIEFFDYTIDQVSTDGNRYSEATLKIPENHQNYGLIWVNDPTSLVTVYGIYPPRDAVKNGGLITGFVDLSIPAPDLSWSGGVGTPTNSSTVDSYMKHAYMVSRPSKFTKDATGSEAWKEKPYVDLDFYPIFNSFYIVLGSQKNEITLNSLTLSNGTSDEPLTGNYKFSYKQRNAQDYTFDATGPTYESIDHTGNLSHSVTVNFPAGTKISPTDSVKFTILTLPPAKSANITNLTLTVNYGNNKTKSLKLDYNNGDPIPFPAFHKARITGLAMEGDVWQLNIMTDVNEWTLVEKRTSFVNQVGFRSYQDAGGRNVLISGMTETGNHEMPNDVPVTDPSYYARYYQIRTLDMSVENPHFVVKFMPSSPIGGYWMLAPEGIGEGSLQYFDIKYHLGEGVYSDELMGQIMGTEVEIHIFPSENFDPNAGVSYAMIMKCFFSAQRSFDDPYNADSEFQDVHGDGRYSYWRFTLPSNN